MDAIIKNYRRGKRTVKPNQAILLIEGIKDKKMAHSLVGKKVVWKSVSGKKLKGKIMAEHGSKGAVRARFEKGLPGQAVGQKVEIL